MSHRHVLELCSSVDGLPLDISYTKIQSCTHRKGVDKHKHIQWHSSRNTTKEIAIILVLLELLIIFNTVFLNKTTQKTVKYKLVKKAHKAHTCQKGAHA